MMPKQYAPNLINSDTKKKNTHVAMIVMLDVCVFGRSYVSMHVRLPTIPAQLNSYPPPHDFLQFLAQFQYTPIPYRLRIPPIVTN